MSIFHYVPHAVITALTGAFGWLVKRFVSDVKDQVSSAVQKLDSIHEMTKNANENHLTHIEANGARTNELLEQIHNGQLEMSGFLKGISGKS